jgi:hypothetical protein
MSYKKALNYFKLIVLIAIPIILLILPANFFDTGQSICLSKVILNKECPGCGSTRAIQHLIHLDFKQAWAFNKLSFIVFAIGAFVWGGWIFSTIKKIKN